MKRGAAVILLIALALRLAILAGADDSVTAWLREKTADGELLLASLNFELGTQAEAAEETAVLEETGAPAAQETAQPTPSPIGTPVPTAAPEVEETPLPTVTLDPDAPEILETTISGGLTINNATSYEIDIDAMMAEGLNLSLTAGEPQILIVHTHGSEAYTPTALDAYVASDTSQTEDKNYNVIRVGDELAAALEGYGLEVIHDREIYDYPSYTGSYTRSGEAIEAYLEQYPSIAIVIDLHRDALGSGDVIYKTVAEVHGESASQVMLLVGTGENGLYHPQWRENLKLALYLQAAMTEKYPTLARPVALKQERYNQQLTTGSLILEVGSSGNTLQEALCAIRLFAAAAGPALAELIAAE